MTQAQVPDLASRIDYRWIIAAFAAAILLQLELVFNRPINWDEIWHLNQAHAFVQGRLHEPLQTLYARALFWVPLLPIDAVDQIRAARMVMFVCEMVAVFAIFGMARRFTSTLPAAIVALAYLTSGYVFQHGFSYRADPIAAAFLMSSLWILLASRLGPLAILGAAILAALAVLTTIKVVFYAPAFAGIAYLRWREAEDARAMLGRLFACAAAAIALSVIFVGLTILSLPEVGPQRAGQTITSSATMVFDEGLFPRWPYIFGAIAAGPVMALLVALAPGQIARSRFPAPRWIALAGLMLPLACLVLYRNAFPYFYTFILPPVAVAAAVTVSPLLEKVRLRFLVAVLVANAAIISVITPREVLPIQRRVIAAVYEIFPEPVAYFDFPGMVVDYPKANFFMSTWGVKKYWQGMFPTFREIMAVETVPLLVVNQPMLERNQTGPEPAWELLPEDAAALRDGFIQHWGPIWVAGRHFSPTTTELDFEVFAPGIYTLEGAAAEIGGAVHAPGDTVMLDRGMHRFRRVDEGPATLRWGNDLPVPSAPFAEGPVFKDF